MTACDWSLRIVHEGHAGLIIERPGRRLRFDPVGPLEHDDIVVLTGAGKSFCAGGDFNWFASNVEK